METWQIVLIVVLILAVVAVLAVVLNKRTAHKRVAAQRDEAKDHRARAEQTQLEADRQAGEAQARAASARQEQIAADRQLQEAETRRGEAGDLGRRADEIDPDVPGDGQREPDDARGQHEQGAMPGDRDDDGRPDVTERR